MQLDHLLDGVPEYAKWRDHLPATGRYQLTGLLDSAKTMALVDLWRHRSQPLMIVVDDLYHAQNLVADLTNLVAAEDVEMFPVEDLMAVEMAASSPDFRRQRVRALDALVREQHKIIVTTVAGMQRFLPQPQAWQDYQVQLELGQDLDLERTLARLSVMGYQRQKMVLKPGEFAVRGSILDIYPLDGENPIRVDLFDTEVDSLRTFDVAEQRSIANIDRATIIPATDFIASFEMLNRAAEQVEKQYQSAVNKTQDQELQEQMQQYFPPVVAALKRGELVAEYLPLSEMIFTQPASVIDYVPAGSIIVYDDYNRLLDHAEKMRLNTAQWQTERMASGRLLPNLALHHDIRILQKADHQHLIIFNSLFAKGMGGMTLDGTVEVKTRAVQQFFGQMPLLKVETDRWHKQGQTVVLLVSDPKRIPKLEQTLADFEIPAIVTPATALQPGTSQIVEASLTKGFELPVAKAVILTEYELFPKTTKKRPRRLTMSNTERLKSYKDLKEGDYVVHVNHGIGRYIGMKTMEVQGKHQDYITIEYQKDDRLFIPVTQLDRIQKYVSAEGKPPHINRLGGSEWKKTKHRVANKIEDIADDLIALYAKRDSEKGHAFPPDDDYQREFEDAFAYTETPDQLRSAKEIKADMEKPKPMDRLLIGDVGFGKTEVALRAAFKAVEDGKQVALLAPTTVLAQQHYETMIERFNDFPVEIGILSRFSTSKQVKETLTALREGRLDIIVGTHRLLSKDVQFADLGLLIIDEEQRFGVKHKERLKELRTNVDVLTLTATPIPRTLNMSMLGVRDLSVIETPPQNRYPIQTYVIEQNYGVVVDAIRRELERGGQVFYLHNRVEDIEQVVHFLNDLVPEARIVAIHGQMTEAQLERTLFDFIAGEYDVLVTTTIIETGVDIPNVNTLLVENADRMGLSQLYQLRGRVGRSNRVAYAYFMYQPNKVLTEVSEKRLEAIKDFTELGSGFKIAMRDLAIRGAGNLLGKQQHGFIDSVGYDLYVEMLNEAIAKKQGQHVTPKTNAEINLDIEGYLPATYIADPQQKIEIYKRISQFENEAQYREVQDDLIDRFGEYPQAVANLLEIGLLKVYADQALVEEIQQKGRRINVIFTATKTQQVMPKQLLQALAVTKLNATINPRGNKTEVSLVVQPKMTATMVVTELQNYFKQVIALISKEATPSRPTKGVSGQNE